VNRGRRALVRGGAQLLGLAALGCSPSPKPAPVADVRLRPISSLPLTELPWLRLRDHFIATVGPSAGQGRPLGSLLVLADATFAPHSRFPLHPHREMEILSIVLSGELSHHGDQSHGATLRPREAQLISARDGMVHAEGNETDANTRMLQLWFTPTRHGGAPAYFRRSVPHAARGGRHLVAGDEAMPLRSDAHVWWLDLAAGHHTAIEVAPGRAGYLRRRPERHDLPGAIGGVFRAASSHVSALSHGVSPGHVKS
jgi:quercetin 2,3-dioxygenase